MSDPMTDDAKLRRILTGSPPPAPDRAARKRALAAGLAAFDVAAGQATSSHTETTGSDEAALSTPAGGGTAFSRQASEGIRSAGAKETARRMRPSVRQIRQTMLGRLRMNTTHLPSGRKLMFGTASAAVLALAVVTGTMIEREASQRQRASETQDAGPVTTLVPLREDARGDAPGERKTETNTAAPATMPVTRPAESPAVQAEQAGAEHATGSATAIAPPPPAHGLAQPSAPTAGLRALAPTARAPAPAPDMVLPGWHAEGRDRFADIEPNGVKVTAEEPVSTFSIDVDTASYSFVRRALMQGVLPPEDAVRIEEMINYFPYDYAPPESRETPFATHVTVMPTPWNAETKLLRIGIQGYDIAPAERPRANLVFLIDTSGSMHAPDRLPLLVNSLRLLVENLEPEDRVAIVAYAGRAGTVLEPTPVAEKGKILAALDRLMAGGSTAGGAGIRQAYRLAEAEFDPDAINRVILATDGDFNVGITSVKSLQDFVERQRESGIYLSVLGFGRGNLNDELMQALAQNGNGQAAYIDTLAEARKALVEEASSTLFPIAEDVKIQVEFNPATVGEYRLIGYETRLLAREDFNNDRVDAGEIGAGHSVTALYEIVPAGSPASLVDPLRYGQAASATDAELAAAPSSDEYAFLKIRYKLPGEEESRLITRAITPADAGAPDDDARFAAAVAAFGQLLRGGEYLGDFGYDDVVRLANGTKGEDPYGYRAGFVTLARLAASLAGSEARRE